MPSTKQVLNMADQILRAPTIAGWGHRKWPQFMIEDYVFPPIANNIDTELVKVKCCSLQIA